MALKFKQNDMKAVLINLENSRYCFYSNNLRSCKGDFSSAFVEGVSSVRAL